MQAEAATQSIDLSWGQPALPDTYDIYRGTSPGEETLYQTGITTNSYSDTGVTPGVRYYYRIQAINGPDSGPLTDEIDQLIWGT